MIPSTAKSGIVALADGVRAYFQANDIPAEVARVGLKYRTFQTNQGPGGGSRIVFIPGDFNGAAGANPLDEGELTDPLKNVSDNPRELAEWRRTVTISVWGVDPTRTEDEQAQLEATESLLELTVRALHNATDPASGALLCATRDEDGTTYGKITRTYPPIENSFGCELLLRLRLSGPLYDVTNQVVTPSVNTLAKALA